VWGGGGGGGGGGSTQEGVDQDEAVVIQRAFDGIRDIPGDRNRKGE